MSSDRTHNHPRGKPMSSLPTDPTRTLHKLSDDYEGQSSAVRDVANRLPATASPLLRAALIHAADVLSTIDLGLYECARTGNIAPLEDLAGRANEWLAEVVSDWAADITFTDGARAATDPDESGAIARLLDEGCPTVPTRSERHARLVPQGGVGTGSA